MNMKKISVLFLVAMLILVGGFISSVSNAYAATTPSLGAAASFGILTGTYTNTTGDTINGDVGYTIPPGTAPTVYGGTIYAAPNVTYTQAGTDQGIALTALSSSTNATCDFAFATGAINLSTDITHSSSTGVFTPGVYCIDGAMSISGPLELSGAGTYIFRSTGALNVVANSTTTLTNGAYAGDVFWTPVATTIGANVIFKGTVIDNAGITVGANTSWTGRALAYGAALGTVTTDTDTISVSVNTVTFDKNGGDVDASPASISDITYGATTTLPTAPTKTGYTFDSWNTLANGSGSTFTAATAVTDNITVYAIWTINNYTLTIPASAGTGSGSYGGTASGSVAYNTAVSITATASTSSNFTSWTATEAASVCNGATTSPCAFNMTGDASVTANYTLKTFTLTYATSSGGTISGTNPQIVNYGEDGSEVIATPDANYHFVSWSDAYPTADRTDTNVQANLSPTANFAIDTHTVTFNNNGGDTEADPISISDIAYGATTTQPSSPEKTEYTFVGWNTIANGSGSAFTSTTTVTADITVYAQWTINEYTITFDSNGGTAVSSITQGYGTAVTSPVSPTMTGYSFVGWNPSIPATMPAGGATLTAEWTVNSYTITFNSNGGSSVDSITQDYGTVVIPPADPTREGYTFTSWDSPVPANMPVGGATLTAQWIADKTALTAAITAEIGAVHGSPVYVLIASDYTSGSWATYTDAIAAAIVVEGNGAATVKEVSDATALIDSTKTALVTNLSAYKLVASSTLDTAYGGYSSGNYSGTNWTTLTGFYTTGISDVTAATTIELVDTATSTAISGMAGVATGGDVTPPQLVSATAVAKDRIDVYFDEDLIGGDLATGDFKVTVGATEYSIDSLIELNGKVTLQLSSDMASDTPVVTINPGTPLSIKDISGNEQTEMASVIATDEIAPTVIVGLGDGSSDYQLPIYTGSSDGVTFGENPVSLNLTFSEKLSDAGKLAVEEALANGASGANQALNFRWGGGTGIASRRLFVYLTGSTTATFPNDVIVASITDLNGNISTSTLLVDSILDENQTAPDESGDATISTTTPEVVITNPTATTTLTINSDVGTSSINVSAFIGSNGTGTLPAINIISGNVSSTTISIPASTLVTSASTSWNGVIAAPTVTTITLPDTSGVTKTLNMAIELGFSGVKLSFDKGVRILFPGQADKRVGYVRTGITFTEITNVCSADNQTVGNALLADTECKINASNGLDLVVWTKHFTTFATYSQTTNAVAVTGGAGGFYQPSVTKTIISTTSTEYKFTSDLQVGSTGADVIELQKLLVTAGHLIMPKGVAYGYFGNATKAAVIKYQLAKGITPAAGYFGPKTRNILISSSASSTTSIKDMTLKQLVQMLLDIGAIASDKIDAAKKLVGIL
jgi:uncharacterized repeat protein (TIGR02543 family)